MADWMAFVKLYLDDEAYRTVWKSIFEKACLDNLAKVSTALCVRYLGLEGNYSWCDCANESIVNRMMEYIFDQGNFGHKKRKSDTGAKSISNSSGFFGFMKQLYKSGVHHWGVRNRKINPERCPVLRPFAWFYGLGHYISELCKKGGIPYLIKSYRDARERRKFFAKLGLYD